MNKIIITSLIAALCLFSNYIFRLNQYKQRVNAVVEARPLSLDGYIASLPQHTNDSWRFNFDTHLGLIKLSWKTARTIHVGENWRLMVSLKKVHGTKSPGAFDYEGWALQQGLVASGRVVNHAPQEFLSHHYYHYPLSQFRELVRNKVKLILPDAPGAVWLLALVLGVRENIPAQYWQVLRATGTNHMMAIGGLHIGAISGIVYLLTSRLCRFSSRLLLFIPAQHIASIAGLVCALFYSILAGFSIPAQRASIMLAVAVMSRLLQKQLNPWRIWFIAFFTVLLINPFDVLSQSFWLSFITIALIIYTMSGRLSPGGLWWRWGRVQFVVAIGLAPLGLFYFQETSIISFVANSLAIPWLTFLILPISFVASLLVLVSVQLAQPLMWLAGLFMRVLWQFLSVLSDLPFANLHFTVPNYILFFFLVLSVLLFLVPKGVPGRSLCLLWVLPLFFYRHVGPANSEFLMHVLDVGQGLSVVVQTSKHVLLYDTGPPLGREKDAGSEIILPFLKAKGIGLIDRMVISHGDSDHIGGAQSILKSMPVFSIVSSVPGKFPRYPAMHCLAGTSWTWDGVEFRFLYPAVRDLGSNNNSSCVLRVSNQSVSVLLPGDIEKRAEIELLSRYQRRLRSEVLLAPHHGSHSSSLLSFVKAVNPQHVIYTTGYLNRFNFPHTEVVARYEKLGVNQLNTAMTGTITFHSKSPKSFLFFREVIDQLP